MKIYEKQYNEIVKNHMPRKYQNPESQGRAIKKCSIQEPTKEIGYRSHSVTTKQKES